MGFIETVKDTFSGTDDLDNKKIHENKFQKLLRGMIYNKGIVHYLNDLKYHVIVENSIMYRSEKDGEIKDIYADVYPSLRLVQFTVKDDTLNIDEGISLQFHKDYFGKSNKVRNIELKNQVVSKVMDDYKFETLKDMRLLKDNEKKFQSIVEEITDDVYKTHLKECIHEKISEHENLLFKDELKSTE